VHALARGTSPAELDAVVNVLSDVDAEVSLAAIAALAEFAPELAARHVVPLVEDRSGYFLPFVRLAATRALIRTGQLEHDVAIRLRRYEQDAAIRAELDQVVTGTVRA
jgi:HEAT repeat protein